MGMFDAQEAFEPFFDDLLIVEGARDGASVAATVHACVLDEGFEEPLTDDGTSSTRRAIVAHIPRKGPHRWSFTWQPQIGDTLVNAFGVRFSIYKVELFDGGEFICKARQTDDCC